MVLKHWEEEEAFHARDRKQFRKEKKRAQQTDRSQFKKSDRPALQLSPSGTGRRGRVIAVSGEGAQVDFGGETSLCSLRGLFKNKISQSKNLIAVGDWVMVNEEGAIAGIEPRFSYLARTDISGKKEQLIAVNIDQALIVASMGSPSLKPALIDRCIIAARRGKILPFIIINKIDLLESGSAREKAQYRAFLAAYEPLGVPILSVSSRSGVGVEALTRLLHNKTSVFAGQSGVGKSSLLNACFGLKLRTGDLAAKTAKGSHTTTSASLIALPQGGYCVDTPGVRSFGIWNLDLADLNTHFFEIHAAAKKCRYADCAHGNEPSCAVLQALAQEKISPIRYESYRHLIKEMKSSSKSTTWR